MYAHLQEEETASASNAAAVASKEEEEDENGVVVEDLLGTVHPLTPTSTPRPRGEDEEEKVEGDVDSTMMTSSEAGVVVIFVVVIFVVVIFVFDGKYLRHKCRARVGLKSMEI